MKVGKKGKKKKKKVYKYVYVVTDSFSPKLKKGNILFWRNVGKEYTIQVISIKDEKPEIKPLANIKLVAILPEATEEALNMFIEVFIKPLRKKEEKEEHKGIPPKTGYTPGDNWPRYYDG